MTEKRNNLLCRQLFDLRFPIKLWIIINSNNQAITWDNSEYLSICSPSSSRESLTSIIVIDSKLLDDYLKSKKSIFVAKQSSIFFAEMKKYNFKILPQPDENASSKIYKFYHEKFLYDQPELLSKIVKPKEKPYMNYYNFPETNLKEKFESFLKLEVRSSARVENLKRTFLKYGENVKLIPLPIDCFLDTLLSESNFEEHSEYAGFYGSYLTAQQIKDFYDEFLPKYVLQKNESPKKAETNDQEILEKKSNNNYWCTEYNIQEVQQEQSQPSAICSENIQNEFLEYLDIDENIIHTEDIVKEEEIIEESYTINILSDDQDMNIKQEIIAPLCNEETIDNSSVILDMNDYLRFNNRRMSLSVLDNNNINMDEEIKIDEDFINLMNTENVMNSTQQDDSFEDNLNTILSRSLDFICE